MTMESPGGATPPAKLSAPLRVAAIVARTLMGLLFTVTGSNGFLNFIPQPKDPMPAMAADFAGAMLKTGYFFPLVMGTQLVAGVLLLSGRFVPLALALIAPVVVNIFAFHVFLAPAGLGMAIFVAALEVFLAWSYRGAFGPMLAMRAAPGPEPTRPR